MIISQMANARFMMPKFTFSDLSKDKLKSIVQIDEKGIVPEIWQNMSSSDRPNDKDKINLIQSYLKYHRLNLMNEATLWARAIYPMLMLAEHDTIEAWAEVPLNSKYPFFELDGIVDGVLGDCRSGMIEAPYLVVIEAKRSLEAKLPQFQVYGAMLAAAWLNWQQTKTSTEQEIFGCYTIGDNWTFIRGIVSDFEADRPVIQLQFSPEYFQRLEAEKILQILKFIVRSDNNPNLISAPSPREIWPTSDEKIY
jgi:hypothetical protein